MFWEINGEKIYQCLLLYNNMHAHYKQIGNEKKKRNNILGNLETKEEYSLYIRCIFKNNN